MKNIETGVDKLVTLISNNKKVSVDEAAKKLGVSKIIVQEWADFLEQDNLISIEYSLSKVWLVERKLSKKEVEKKTKEYTNKKESFVRKVETTLKSLDRDTLGFEKMKEEFSNLKKNIGGELGDVETDLRELEHYDDLKKSIAKDIEAQEAEYKRMLEQSHQEIRTEEKRYRSMLAQVEQEKMKVLKERTSVNTSEAQEAIVEKKILEMTNLLNDVRERALSEEHTLEVSEENIKKLELYIEQVGKRLKNKKHEAIMPLVKLSEEHSVKVMNLQKQILKKLRSKQKEISQMTGQNKKVYHDLKKFFDKKEKAEKLLATIEKRKASLEQEYQHLFNKAQAFNAISKDATVTKHIAELEKEYKKVESHRSNLGMEIEKLTNFIKG